MGFGSLKTAWYMARRFRSALIEKNMDKLGGIVEVDEGFIGGQAEKSAVVAAALVLDTSLKLRSSARRHTLKYQQHFGFVSPKPVFDRRRGDLARLLLAVP